MEMQEIIEKILEMREMREKLKNAEDILEMRETSWKCGSLPRNAGELTAM